MEQGEIAASPSRRDAQQDVLNAPNADADEDEDEDEDGYADENGTRDSP